MRGVPPVHGPGVTRWIGRHQTASLVAALGLAAEYLGASWDIAWHSDIGRDSFFTPPHLLMLCGGLILGVGTSVALALGPSYARRGPGLGPRPGLALAVWAAALQGISLGVDNWWHGIFGVDVQLWSPPHLLLLVLGVLASIAVLADWKQGPAPSPWVLAVVCGIFMGSATVFAQEYVYGFPHFRVLWYGLTIAAVFGFWTAMARRLSPLSLAGTIAGGTSLLLQLAAVSLNTVAARSVPTPAIALLVGGVVSDAVLAFWPEARSRSWVHLVTVPPAWAAAAIVQAIWLRAFGRVWWPDAIIPAELVAGCVVALAGAGLGVVVGDRLRRRTGLRQSSAARASSLGRELSIAATFLLVIGGVGALLAAVTPSATATPKVAIVSGSYEVHRAKLWRDGERLRLSLDGAGAADWVSVFGSRRGQESTPWAGGLTWDGTYLSGTADTRSGFVWYSPGDADGAWSGGFTVDNGTPVSIVLVKSGTFGRVAAPVWLEATAFGVVAGLLLVATAATGWVVRDSGSD